MSIVKKIILFLVALSMSLLCSCRPAQPQITPANPVEPPPNIYVGMPREEFLKLYPKESCFYYWHNYAFFEDVEGNPVVVAFEADASYNSTIAAIHAYDKNEITVTSDTFTALERGMPVHEIVALLGNPLPICNNGVEVLEYKFDNMQGMQYSVYLSGKTELYDDELVLRYYACRDLVNDSMSFPMGTEPWEYVDPE